jgi:hypothetical protein
MTNVFPRARVRYGLQVCAVLFVVCCVQQSVVNADPSKPILVSVPTSTRAVAMDAVTFTPEPFSPRPDSFLYGPGKPTSIMLFVLNLSLKAGEDASALKADAEDGAHRHYDLKVEYAGKVSGQEWLSQVNLRLDSEMGDVGDVLVSITYQGVSSNRVRVGVGHVGGGPEDDAGASATPAPPYTISGRITSGATGLGGVSVTLGGAQTGTVMTGDDGGYSFTVTSVGNYTLTPSKNLYSFTPPDKGFDNLSGNRTADFAIKFYSLRGRVVDNNGKGIYGIVMRLSGPETGDVYTALDGSYSFAVATAGDYTITPLKEQYFYQFSPPSQSFIGLSDNQTTNFTAAIVITSPTYVLEFDGTPMSADYGVFWPHDTTVGNFFWEFWAMPGENTQGRYLLSDGYGGAHTLLFGFGYGPRGYNLTGNIWDGTQTVSFFSDEGPSVGEWGHYAVGWDGKNIMTYYDGVPVGKTPFTGPRVSLGTGSGATLLLIGGSTHQNLIGRIAQVRGYEENNPRESSPESSFAPQTVFSVEGQLLSYYFRPAERVADLSYGYNGGQHLGWPRGMQDFYFNYTCPGCPIPQFVVDPTAPDFSNPANPGHAKTLVVGPPATPGGSLVFDSFSRDNSTYILGGKGGLGATEQGAAGAKTWQTNMPTAQPQPFGILGGRAVPLADDTTLAWVSTGAGSANLDVRVERTVGSFGSGVNTGLCFRVADKNNFFFAYTTDDEANPSAPKRLTLGYYLSGVRTILAADIALPQGNWKTLRVVTTQTGAINIYADNVPVHFTNSAVHALATGAGLYNRAAGMGLSNRWDNFTVFEVP